MVLLVGYFNEYIKGRGVNEDKLQGMLNRVKGVEVGGMKVGGRVVKGDVRENVKGGVKGGCRVFCYRCARLLFIIKENKEKNFPPLST